MNKFAFINPQKSKYKFVYINKNYKNLNIQFILEFDIVDKFFQFLSIL